MTSSTTAVVPAATSAVRRTARAWMLNSSARVGPTWLAPTAPRAGGRLSQWSVTGEPARHLTDILADMRKTTLTIDDDLVRRAADVLGTGGLKATVDAALQEVVAADARRRFVERLRAMRGLDLDQPEVMAGAWR